MYTGKDIGKLSYQRALDILGKRDEKVIAGNTKLVRHEDFSVAVRHWNTEILTFYADGRMKIDTNGYHTVTTKARLNAYLPLPWGVWSERGDWVLSGYDMSYVYEDGMVMPSDGTIDLMPLACSRLNTWFEVHKINQTVSNAAELDAAIASFSLEDISSVWKRLRKDRCRIAEHCREDFLPIIAVQEGNWSRVVARRLGSVEMEVA